MKLPKAIKNASPNQIGIVVGAVVGWVVADAFFSFELPLVDDVEASNAQKLAGAAAGALLAYLALRK